MKSPPRDLSTGVGESLRLATAGKTRQLARLAGTGRLLGRQMLGLLLDLGEGREGDRFLGEHCVHWSVDGVVFYLEHLLDEGESAGLRPAVDRDFSPQEAVDAASAPVLVLALYLGAYLQLLAGRNQNLRLQRRSPRPLEVPSHVLVPRAALHRPSGLPLPDLPVRPPQYAHQLCISLRFPPAAHLPLLQTKKRTVIGLPAGIELPRAPTPQQPRALPHPLHFDQPCTTAVNLFLELDHILYMQDAVAAFPDILEANRMKAEQKKDEYLERIMLIFREFVSKSEEEIDRIIQRKLERLEDNYTKIVEYLRNEPELNSEERSLIISEYLVKPFQKFPFSGNKNEKAFRDQYSLIEKASLLIEQTLVDSFNEDEVPTFASPRFFEAVRNNGLGLQSLTRLNINPQDLGLQAREDLVPIQKSIHSLKMMGDFLVLVGDEAFLEIWDLEYRTCIRKLYLDNLAPVSCLGVVREGDLTCLAVGFGDHRPEVTLYRSDNWQKAGCSLSHTRTVTKIVQSGSFILSGSIDGDVCVYRTSPFRELTSCPHISSIEDIICKQTRIFVLLKSSSLCEYELDPQGVLVFRRSLSTGFISMLRFPELAGNLNAVACHIYGLSQVQITRKCKVQQTNIINVAQMIADFVVLESKQNSEYYAVCGFQNSSAMRIYSLRTGEAIFGVGCDYLGEVGVAGYMPKVEIAWVEGEYQVLVVSQSEFEEGNYIRCYRLTL